MYKKLPIPLKLFFSLVVVVIGYLILFELTLLASRLIYDPLDRSLLLILQPDNYIPILDELIVFITHFSTYLFSITALSWLITQLIVRNNVYLAHIATRIWKTLAIVLGIYHLCGIWFASTGIFWWRPHQYKIVFIFLSIASFALFWLGAKTWSEWNYTDRKLWLRVLLVTLLSVLFTNYFGEDNIKRIVGRPRPLHEKNEPWNKQVRVIPDEVVKASPSYISGHASSLFALLTPAIWATRRRWVKGALMSWAIIHAYSRIYTAAHFPYCVIMGSLFGFSIGSLCYWSFWWCLQPRTAIDSCVTIPPKPLVMAKQTESSTHQCASLSNINTT